MKRNSNLTEHTNEKNRDKFKKQVALTAMSGILLTGCGVQSEQLEEELESDNVNAIFEPKDYKALKDLAEQLKKQVANGLEIVEKESPNVEELSETDLESVESEISEDEYLASVRIRNYDGPSIADGLYKNDYPNDKGFRAKLAVFHGVVDKLGDYKGTDKQNIELLDILRERDLTLTLQKTEKKDKNEEKIEEHVHNFSYQYYYVSNGDGTHHVENKCIECGEIVKSQANFKCNYGKYIYNPLTNRDERVCENCGFIDPRVHVHNSNNNQDNHDDKGHDNNPSNNDEHEENKKHEHKFSKWKFLNDELEQSTCKCGKKRTRPHSYAVLDEKYEYLENGKHVLIRKHQCLTCNHVKEEKVEETCEMTEWKYNPATKQEESTCLKCKHIEPREHVHDDFNEEDENAKYDKILQDYSNPGYHIVEYKCNGCHETVKKDVKCKSDGKVYFKTVDGVIYEVESCGKCHAEMNEKVHTHQLDLNKDKTTDDKEYYDCKCGKVETRDHDYNKGVYNAEKGEIVYTCQHENCQHEKHVEHKNHDYKINLEKTTDEYEYYECDVCGNHKTVVHDYEVTYDADTKEVVYRCKHSNCKHEKRVPHKDHGYKINLDKTTDEYEYYECICGEYNIKLHAYGKPVYNEETGMLDYTCQHENCKHVKSVKHTHENETYQEKYETLTDVEGDFHKLVRVYKCGAKETILEKEACESDGIKHTKTDNENNKVITYEMCKHCGKHINEKTECLNHNEEDYVINLKETTDAYEYYECKNCGKVAKRGHAYGTPEYNEETGKLDYTCQHANCKHVKSVKHTHENETYQEKYETLTDVEGDFHKLVRVYKCGAKKTILEKEACVSDGKKYTEEDEKLNTKTTYEVCEHCGKHINVIVECKEHSYVIDKTTNDKEYWVCSKCGKEHEDTHDYGDETPDFKVDGLVKICSKTGCQHKMTTHNHSWSEWEYDTTNPGNMKKTCSCGSTQTEEHTEHLGKENIYYKSVDANHHQGCYDCTLKNCPAKEISIGEPIKCVGDGITNRGKNDKNQDITYEGCIQEGCTNKLNIQVVGEGHTCAYNETVYEKVDNDENICYQKIGKCSCGKTTVLEEVGHDYEAVERPQYTNDEKSYCYTQKQECINEINDEECGYEHTKEVAHVWVGEYEDICNNSPCAARKTHDTSLTDKTEEIAEVSEVESSEIEESTQVVETEKEEKTSSVYNSEDEETEIEEGTKISTVYKDGSEKSENQEDNQNSQDDNKQNANKDGNIETSESVNTIARAIFSKKMSALLLKNQLIKEKNYVSIVYRDNESEEEYSRSLFYKR